MQLIVQGVKEIQQVKIGVAFKSLKLRKKKGERQQTEKLPVITKESFVQIGREENL